MSRADRMSADDVVPASDYDRFVNWEKRLAREGPFFRDAFAARSAARVIDMGCGTGKHAIMYASWGLSVVGVDPDESMLAQARENASVSAGDIEAAGGSLRFAEGGFGDLERSGLGLADAVTCTGNALPHVDGLHGLRTAVVDFAAALQPGGLLVLHLLNHDRLLAQRPRTIPPVVREDNDGTWVFLRVMDYADSGIRFDFVTLHRPAGAWGSGAEWETTWRRSLHTALPSALLTSELRAGGFGDIRLFGGHDAKAYDPDTDESVIVTAVRG